MQRQSALSRNAGPMIRARGSLCAEVQRHRAWFAEWSPAGTLSLQFGSSSRRQFLNYLNCFRTLRSTSGVSQKVIEEGLCFFMSVVVHSEASESEAYVSVLPRPGSEVGQQPSPGVCKRGFQRRTCPRFLLLRSGISTVSGGSYSVF